LDLPNDDGIIYVDEDLDSSNDFEIGIVNAGNKKNKRQDSDNSFDRQSSDGIEIQDDVGINDFLNSSGTKRTI
jgi:hypothetical protein